MMPVLAAGSGVAEGAATRAGTALEAALRRLLPPGIAVAWEDPAAPSGALRPVEEAAIARAIPKRRLEFAAGRSAARRAMRELGLPEAALPMGTDRAPVWPPGLTGSIAHCEGACVAILARTGTVSALGIDIEPDRPLPEGLEAIICTPAERAWLERQPAGQRDRLAILIFSAKEAVFKAQYPLTGRVLEFGEVEVSVDLAEGRFRAMTKGSGEHDGWILSIRERVVTVSIIFNSLVK